MSDHGLTDVCPICDGGPGNDCACTCPDGPPKTRVVALLEIAPMSNDMLRLGINGRDRGHVEAGPEYTQILRYIEAIRSQHPELSRFAGAMGGATTWANVVRRCADEGWTFAEIVRTRRRRAFVLAM